MITVLTTCDLTETDWTIKSFRYARLGVIAHLARRRGLDEPVDYYRHGAVYLKIRVARDHDVPKDDDLLDRFTAFLRDLYVADAGRVTCYYTHEPERLLLERAPYRTSRSDPTRSLAPSPKQAGRGRTHDARRVPREGLGAWSFTGEAVVAVLETLYARTKLLPKGRP